MKKSIIIIAVTIILLPVSVCSQSKYPDFNKEYWINSQSLAKGKILRGAGLGSLGLVSIWPTTLLVYNAMDNPQKYGALGVVLALSSLSATLHGFGSVGFGKKQYDVAATFKNSYDHNPDSVSTKQEQSEFIHNQKKTSIKVAIFGSYLTTVSSILLINGIVQSVHKGQNKEMKEIRIWPYYLAGGALITSGVGIILNSKRKIENLKGLEAITALPEAGIVPLIGVTENGHWIFGVAFGGFF